MTYRSASEVILIERACPYKAGGGTMRLPTLSQNPLLQITKNENTYNKAWHLPLLAALSPIMS